MDLSIVYVNWNSEDYLRESISSIWKCVHDISYEIIIVDNASPKNDADRLAHEFPDIRLIKSPENLGFARANNLGFSYSSGKYLLFLNPDTQVLGPAIQRMVRSLQSLPHAGVIGCKLLNSDRSIQTSCIQRFPTILNQMLDIEALRLRWPAWRVWQIDALFSFNEEPSAVEAVSGACLMIRREVFESVNRFSEDYFMYAEDVDLCFKVHRAGFVNYFIGEAKVIHHGGGSSRHNGADRWSVVAKREAIQQLCLKMHGPAYALMLRGTTAAAALARLLIVFPMFFIGRISAQKQHIHSTWRKWMTVLRWSIGLETSILKSPSRH